jgi:hypothetical protein
MRFFTRELYLRFHSVGDASAEWDEAVRDYHSHLSRIAGTMNDRVRRFAEDLCLHDAALLALREDFVTLPFPTPTQTPVAILSLRGIGRLFTLFYLSWGEMILSTAPERWPFSTLPVHWLCDEIDLDLTPSPFPRYDHRILLSDGREITIPFVDVIVHSFSEQDAGTARITPRKT